LSNVTYWPRHRQAGAQTIKYSVNTSHCSRFVLKCFTAVLFGNNGNSYTVCTQSDWCTGTPHREAGRARKHRVFNLKVDRQLSREYFTSDAIYNGSAGTTFCYYMCKSWQDCCRRGEYRSWPSVSVESVDSVCWCLSNAIFYAFIMLLTVEERVFILESYLKTMSYAHCRQSFFEKF